MAGMDDTPLLTRGQVERWKARDREIELDLQRLAAEQRDIQRKLAAAAEFMGPASEPVRAEEPKVVVKPQADAEPVTDAIVRVAGTYKEVGALPGELKSSLAASGADMSKFAANPGYFYTVLGRLVTRGRLERRRNGAYRVPQQQPSSPQGETGVVGTPALSSTH